MGNSYVQVYLDTTPPILTLHYPPTTSQNNTELITISSNENLSSRQEIKIVDSLNNEHHYTFFLEENKRNLVGSISFNDYPKGIATLYVRLFDEVDNQSSTYQGAIAVSEIVVSDPQIQSLKLSLSHGVADLKLSVATQNITLSAQ